MTQEKGVAIRKDTSVMGQKEAMYLLKTIWKDAPETEVIKAAILCRQYNLNPLMGHIFLIKFGKDWTIVRGIKAKRTMAQAKHRYSYADGPRVMTEDEQVKIFGEVEKEKIWAFVLLKDQSGSMYPGYGFWPRGSDVYGSDKGNSPRNMAFIRAESNALDKLEPGELPGMETVDENFIVGDFQAALAEGKQELIENADQDIEDYWPEGKKPEPPPESKSKQEAPQSKSKPVKAETRVIPQEELEPQPDMAGKSTPEQHAKIREFAKSGIDVKAYIKKSGWSATTAAELTYGQAETIIREFSKEK